MAKKAAPKAHKLRKEAPGAPLSDHTVLFGGSFNPPHIGHQLTALYLLEALGAKEVIVCPAAAHADKKSLPAIDVRLRWLKGCFHAFGGRVVLSDIEARLGGTSYTHTTVLALNDELAHRRWAFCIGSDLAFDVMRWHRAKELVSMALPVVLRRCGYPIDEDDVARALGKKPVISPIELPEVASSTVRERFAAGASLAGLVPAEVVRLLAASPPPW